MANSTEIINVRFQVQNRRRKDIMPNEEYLRSVRLESMQYALLRDCTERIPEKTKAIVKAKIVTFLFVLFATVNRRFSIQRARIIPKETLCTIKMQSIRPETKYGNRY